MRTTTPKHRLRDFESGTKVRLTGHESTLTVGNKREDGYIELTNGIEWKVIASPCHLVSYHNKPSEENELKQ